MAIVSFLVQRGRVETLDAHLLTISVATGHWSHGFILGTEVGQRP